MRSARPSTPGRGSMLALVLASAALPAALVLGQAPATRMTHPGAILVQVMDTSINPLPADIVLPAFGLGVRLSDEGVALLLNIPDGVYLVQARHLGHRPEWRVVRIAGDTARIDAVLPPADAAAGGGGWGLAESRLRDFLRRSASIQQASFINRAEIERRHPRNLAALLVRLSELAIDRAGPGPAVLRSRRVARPGCDSGVMLFVDGMFASPPAVAAGVPGASVERPSARGVGSERAMLREASVGGDGSGWSAGATARESAGVEPMIPERPRSARRGPSPLEWLPISLVGAVEIYPTAADVPAEFRVAGAECGVVLVWTVRK